MADCAHPLVLCSVVKIQPQRDGDERRVDKRPEVLNLQTKKVSAAQYICSDDDSFDLDLIQKEAHRIQTFVANTRQAPKPTKAASRASEAAQDEKENIQDRPWRANLSPAAAARAPGVIHARPWTAALGTALAFRCCSIWLHMHPRHRRRHCYKQ
jgi:hypothetical protein